MDGVFGDTANYIGGGGVGRGGNTSEDHYKSGGKYSSRRVVEFPTVVCGGAGYVTKEGLSGVDGELLKDQRGRPGFGAELGWQGLYRVFPVMIREASVFEYDRGE